MPVRRPARQQVFQQQQHDRAQRPAPSMADAAEQHHDHDRGRLRPMQCRRADELVMVDEQRARQPRQRAGQHEGRQLQPEGGEAQRLHPHLVLADADQRPPETRIDQPVEHQHHRGEQQHHQRGELRIAGQVNPGQRLPARQVHAIFAAPGLQADCQVVDHLREGQRDHDEVDAARSQRDRAHHRRERRRGQHRQRPRHQRIGDTLHAQDARDIGAHAEERRMAQADQSAKAQDQIQAGGQQREDQHAPQEARVELQPEMRRDPGKDRGQREQHPRQGGQPGPSVRTGAHARAGNNPPGRKNSTAAIST